MNTPDNYDVWKHHEDEQEKRLAELPVCDCCDEPIQDDHYYLINSDNICPDCLENYYRTEVDI